VGYLFAIIIFTKAFYKQCVW